jgi:hypothetical protein
VDCQGKRDHQGRRWGEGTMIPPYDHQWSVPEEMKQPRERRVTVSEKPRVLPSVESEGSQTSGSPHGAKPARKRSRRAK